LRKNGQEFGADLIPKELVRDPDPQGLVLNSGESVPEKGKSLIGILAFQIVNRQPDGFEALGDLVSVSRRDVSKEAIDLDEGLVQALRRRSGDLRNIIPFL
jgi:hypothetical protein